jgi:hypothetical protein
MLQKIIVCCSPWLLACALLAACGGATPADDEAAVQVVRDFVAAWEAGDTSSVLTLIEPAEWREEIGPEVRAYTGRIEQLRFENPSYELVDNTGEVAHVRLRGTLNYRLRESGTGEQEVDILVEVAKIDGSWYVRGVDLFESFQR